MRIITFEPMANSTSEWATNRNLLASLVAALALVGAAPASAQTLFTGAVKEFGAIFGPTGYTTVTAPSNTASVTPAGNFTLPANAFTRASAYTFTSPPVYPYVYIRITQANHAGSFGNNYLSPSAALTFNATNNLLPKRQQTPREGFVRLMPGPNGFGGKMPMQQTRYYDFLYVTSLATLQAFALTTNQQFGGESLGYWWVLGHTPGGLCCTSYPTTDPKAIQTAKDGMFVGPWVTGMATAYVPHGESITTTTATGTDARAAFDTGVISLVTPRVTYVYRGDGVGSLDILSQGFAYVHRMDISFLPEPGQIALLTSGLVALLALSRLRRNRG